MACDGTKCIRCMPGYKVLTDDGCVDWDHFADLCHVTDDAGANCLACPYVNENPATNKCLINCAGDCATCIGLNPTDCLTCHDGDIVWPDGTCKTPDYYGGYCHYLCKSDTNSEYLNIYATSSPLNCYGTAIDECMECRDGYYLAGEAPNTCLRKSIHIN